MENHALPLELVDPEPGLSLTRGELLEINQDSARIGLSRTLGDDQLAALPAEIPIVGAWRHSSGQGQRNMRLEIMIGTNGDELHLFDVSVERWEEIKLAPDRTS